MEMKETRPVQKQNIGISSNRKATVWGRMHDYFNRHKTAAYFKNQLLSSVVFIAGGWGGAEVTSMLTTKSAVIASCSTASQYAFGVPVFAALHYFDNKEIYSTGERINWQRIAVDSTKLAFSFVALDAAYLIARPMVHYWFMKHGFEPGTASLCADSICTPVYCALATVWAKSTGVFKQENPSGLM